MVSDLGRVRSFKNDGDKILKPIIRSGYPCVVLSRGVVVKNWTIHRLVASVFKGNPLALREVDHVRGDKMDARANSLEYVSSSENKKRAYRLGLMDKKGERHAGARLKNDQVLDIFYSGKPQYELSRIYMVAQSEISGIKSGKVWGHITGKKYQKKGIRRLTQEEVVTIRNESGTCRAIASKYGLAFSTVNSIKTGYTH